MEIFIIISLVLINGIFSMSEIAVVSSRKFRLDEMAGKGSDGAKKALELAESPGKFLSTVQIGITLIGILLGIYSGENVTESVKASISAIPVLQPFAHDIAIISVLLGITFLSIVLGEIFPKRIGLTYPETIAALIARPMDLLSKITAPFVWLLGKTNDLLLRLFGIHARSDGIITEDEIKSMISESAESGEIQAIEQDIVERVFALGDRKTGSLMTHRGELIWLDLRDSPRQIRSKIGQELHDAYPVCDNDLDNILGIVLLKDLFHQIGLPDFELKNCIIAPVYTPETTSAYKLLDDFRKGGIHFAVVVDEFGTVQGMISMDDLLDALVGDISPEGEREYGLEETGSQTWVADGRFPFFEFLTYFKLDDKEFSGARFSTLGGFAIYKMDSMPKKGDKFKWKDFDFEVLSMDGRRIEKLAVRRRPSAQK